MCMCAFVGVHWGGKCPQLFSLDNINDELLSYIILR